MGDGPSAAVEAELVSQRSADGLVVLGPCHSALARPRSRDGAAPSASRITLALTRALAAKTLKYATGCRLGGGTSAASRFISSIGVSTTAVTASPTKA